ncbi:MAG: zinc metalloprotease HtpX [Acidobacteria bacterium]|nr:MAG: zinc metalloprotease HtpX [Acidobacteriota bacterium]PYQ25114.1 MAG: zinc metalloprotease HtpX [Acidobacteriota bacterium]
MNTMKTTVLLAAMTALLLLVGEAIGGRSGITVALLFAAVMNFAAWFWSDKIVLASYRAQPVGPQEAPELYAIVDGLAARAGIPMPRLYVIPDPALNAFATGRSPSHAAVAATEGILRAMSRDELEGVLAHELSHVINRDTLTSTVAATLAGAITWVAHMAYFMPLGRDRDDEGGNPLVMLLTLLLAPLAAMLIQLAVSRSREYEADTSGARLVGHPEGLANALRRLQAAAERIPMRSADPATAHLFIVNPLSGRSLAGLFSTHPPLEKRIERLMSLRG